MVFPRTGNYSNTLLHREENGALYISHKASGADNFRYSTNFGSSWSDWQAYTAWNTTVLPPTWSGTSSKKWSGKHVSVQYWGRLVGSSDQIQQGDLVDPEDNNWPVPRRYPHFFILGTFNEYGYDTSLPSAMKQDRSGIWNYDLVAEWPSKFIATVWGVDGHGMPDLTRAFGDVDGDNGEYDSVIESFQISNF
jgi:alpha-1,3-glucan synthase